MDKWEQLYQALGIQDFIYFISSPSLQDRLLPVKIVFLLFAVFFLCATVWFYMNSSYLRYQFLQDTAEFLSWQSYGLSDVNKRWRRIVKKITFGNESEYKLAIIEADELLYQTLESKVYEGETFEELLSSAIKKKVTGLDLISGAHTVRNAVVYNVDYKLNTENAKKILFDYENAIKNVAAA